ncbi:MAG TPA: PASTA domain-containing protein [Ornithinibacter sp.]|nr:PASTA domain-containing protein [Ornithinibacter sp.]
MTTVSRCRSRQLPRGRRIQGAAAALALALSILLLPVAAPAAASAAMLPAANREPPNVVGLPLPEAQALIQEQWYPRFTPTIRVEPDLPKQVPPDAARVVDQAVVQYLEDSSEIDLAAIIELTAGSVVADLVGRTRDEAEGLVDALGLSLKATGTGRVDSQDPAAGTLVPFGTTVEAVLVPPASNTRTVPALLDLTEAEARAAVEGVDLVLRVGGSSGDGEPTVAQQDPRAGTEVDAGDAVTVTLVGSGPATATVAVPDVTGLEPQVVQRVLDAAGLVLALDPGGPDEGLSFRQDPEAGTQVAAGTTVTVAFAVVDETGPASVVVWSSGAVLLAVVVLGLWLLRSSRRPPSGPPAPPDVTVRPHPDPAPAVSVQQNPAGHDLVVRVVPGPDPGRLTLTEEPP